MLCVDGGTDRGYKPERKQGVTREGARHSKL